MEAQTIKESVPRIMFVTSADNKIVDESQVPSNVSTMTILRTKISNSFMIGVPHQSRKRLVEAELGGGWVISRQDGMWIRILEGSNSNGFKVF
jgi:hypothetical protein